MITQVTESSFTQEIAFDVSGLEEVRKVIGQPYREAVKVGPPNVDHIPEVLRDFVCKSIEVIRIQQGICFAKALWVPPKKEVPE